MYAKQYDEINDRYERLVKLSRDITIASKRVIFQLLRMAEDDKSLIKAKIDEQLKPIFKNLALVSAEISNLDYWRYHRAFSPGIQEFIESLVLYHYLLHENLMSREEVENVVYENNPEKKKLVITYEDYILGVCDFTGEAMRLCINSVSCRKFEKCRNIYQFLQFLYGNLLKLPDVDKEVPKKLSVMAASLKKVEMVNFNLELRGTEYPLDFNQMDI